MQDGHSCPSHGHKIRSKRWLFDLDSRSLMRPCLVNISDMNVQATGIAALHQVATNPARFWFQSLRIWPQCAKLSRQDAATAIRQDVGPHNCDLQSIGLRQTAKPRCPARSFLISNCSFCAQLFDRCSFGFRNSDFGFAALPR